MDVPLATTEGFRNMPVLWGSDRKDYGVVTDWKSGGVVAGKNLVQGLADGFYDVAMEPIKGARKEGTWGAMKGVAKGSASLVTKAASGGLGLLAYPGQGVSKSLYDVFHSSTRHQVLEARLTEADWMIRRLPLKSQLDIVDRYFDLQRQNQQGKKASMKPVR